MLDLSVELDGFCIGIFGVVVVRNILPSLVGLLELVLAVVEEGRKLLLTEELFCGSQNLLKLITKFRLVAGVLHVDKLIPDHVESLKGNLLGISKVFFFKHFNDGGK